MVGVPPYQLAARGHNQVQRDNGPAPISSEVGELLSGGTVPRGILKDPQRRLVPRRTEDVGHELDLMLARARPERLRPS
jgi:hypothetical protein